MKKVKSIIIFMLVFVMLILVPGETTLAYTDYTEEECYVYNRMGFQIKIPAPYEYTKYIDLKKLGGYSVTSLTDLHVDFNDNIYIVDSKLGAIFFLDKEFNYIKTLTEFTMPDGTITTLNSPNGVFVSKDNELYIADTSNGRILVCDMDGNVRLEVLKPESILGTDLESFLPIRVVADSAGRISVVARNINSGIMQFTSEGIFSGYSGAPAVHVSAWERLKRKFYTEEQKASLTTYVPTEYNSIKIDELNFIWGTISTLSTDSIISTINSMDLSGSTTPIKKLNTMGSDVLRRKDTFAPLGELSFVDTPSKIVDVGLGQNGIYSLLDTQYGKVFTYNENGILLYVFGNKGTKKGNMQTPIAMDYIDNTIVVMDSSLCQLIVYEPTSYGQLLIDAEGYFIEGNYEMSNKLWKEVAELNSNFEYAYIGLGNAEYSAKSYEAAMEYYEFADSPDDYSNAKTKLRKLASNDIFPVVFITIISLVAIYLIVNMAIKIRRYARGEMTIEARSKRKGEDDE